VTANSKTDPGVTEVRLETVMVLAMVVR